MNVSVLDCGSWTNPASNWNIFLQLSTWVDGVAVGIVSGIGVLLNCAGVFRSLRCLSSNNIFNHMILILFIADGLFLSVMAIIKMDDKLGWNNRVMLIVWPTFLHPIAKIFLSLSIFMTVGISHERYIAIKNPIIQRQKMSSAKCRRITLVKYILPILCCATGFNIPSFLEFEVALPNKP